MILVTGSAGKTGQALMRQLVVRGEEVRALVRKPSQGSRLIDLGATDIHVGDMRKHEDVLQAAEGVRAIYHICPNVSPDEFEIGMNAIRAAEGSGVEKFVYHSVLHPQVEKMPHHWQKMRVEELLFESSLNFTILQPAAYMQNILASWEMISEDGIYEIPYSVDAHLSIVDLLDVAEVAGIVLTEPGHDWAIYELSGPEPLSQVEVARILSDELDRPVRARQLSIADWHERAATSGIEGYAAQTLIDMFKYYDAYGFWGNSTVLEFILGRPAYDFRAFVQRTIAVK